jgi:hypothetical protein
MQNVEVRRRLRRHHDDFTLIASIAAGVAVASKARHGGEA